MCVPTAIELRNRQLTKFVIEHDFYRFWRTKAVGVSDTRFEFVVQALHRTEGELSTGLEPIQDERLVGAEHARE